MQRIFLGTRSSDVTGSTPTAGPTMSELKHEIRKVLMRKKSEGYRQEPERARFQSAAPTNHKIRSSRRKEAHSTSSKEVGASLRWLLRFKECLPAWRAPSHRTDYRPAVMVRIVVRASAAFASVAATSPNLLLACQASV